MCKKKTPVGVIRTLRVGAEAENEGGSEMF